MTYKIRNRFASIATNDPENDPTPRVLLERTVRAGRVIWVVCENPDIVVADGRTASEANIGLRSVYAAAEWDLRMLHYGIHTLRVGELAA